MTKKKYLVLAGSIVSHSDGQKHYISGPQLMRLYGVNPVECVCMEEKEYFDRYRHGLAPEHLKDLIMLCARYDGDYSLPTS